MTALDKLAWTAAYLEMDDKILVRRRGEGVIDAGMYGPPGGKVEVNETVEECLFRELEEETGLVGSDEQLVQIYDTPRGVCFFYRVGDWTGTLTNERGHGSWYWLHPEQLEDEMVQGSLARWLGGHAPLCIPLLGNHDGELAGALDEAQAIILKDPDGPEIRELFDAWSGMASLCQVIGLIDLGHEAEDIATQLQRAIHPAADEETP